MRTMAEEKVRLGERYKYTAEATLEDVKKAVVDCEVPDKEVPFVLELGNIDLEVGIHGDNDVIEVYYCCCVCEDGKWRTHSFPPVVVNLDAEDLESEMFSILCHHAETEGLLDYLA